MPVTAQPRAFPVADLISVITDRLVSPNGAHGVRGVYAVLRFMAGEPIFTREIGRAREEAKPALLRQHPRLEEVIPEADLVTPDNVAAWNALWAERYGAELLVMPMTADERAARSRAA